MSAVSLAARPQSASVVRRAHGMAVSAARLPAVVCLGSEPNRCSWTCARMPRRVWVRVLQDPDETA